MTKRGPQNDYKLAGELYRRRCEREAEKAQKNASKKPLKSSTSAGEITPAEFEARFMGIVSPYGRKVRRRTRKTWARPLFEILLFEDELDRIAPLRHWKPTGGEHYMMTKP